MRRVSPFIHRRRRGYSLVLVTVMITYMALLGLSLAGLAAVSGRAASHRRDGSGARNLAMAGIDEAGSQLKQSANWTGFTDRSLGNGTLSVSVTTPSGQSTQRVVVATGTVTGMNYTQTRQIRAAFSTGGVAPVYYNALAAKTSFTINGHVTIGSSPATHQGNVQCNQDVVLKGSAMNVDGYVHATGVVSTSGSPTVTQGMLSGVPPMTFPEVDAAFENQALANGSQTPPGGTLSVNSASTLVQGRILGNLAIGSSGCTITGVVWVTGNLTVSGPVTGTGTLVCDGAMALSAGYNVSSTDTNNVVYVSTSTSDPAVDLGGNSSFKGIVYVPYGGVRLHGTPTLIGGIMANAVTLSGTPTITRWTNFDQNPPVVPSIFQLKGWEELNERPE